MPLSSRIHFASLSLARIVALICLFNRSHLSPLLPALHVIIVNPPCTAPESLPHPAFFLLHLRRTLFSSTLSLRGFSPRLSAGFTAAGAFLGAVAHGYLEHALPSGKSEDAVLASILGMPFKHAAAAAAGCLIMVVMLLESLYPWRTPTEALLARSGPLTHTAVAWPYISDLKWVPAAAGALAGLCQLPSVLLVNSVLASHPSFSTVRPNHFAFNIIGSRAGPRLIVAFTMRVGHAACIRSMDRTARHVDAAVVA